VSHSPTNPAVLGITADDLEVMNAVQDIDLSTVLNEVGAAIRRFVVLTDAERDAAVLWVAHTHAFDAAEFTPYLRITSAEKRSGKSTLLELLEHLVRKPALKSGGASVASLMRYIEQASPTVLLDELDVAFARKGAEDLRGLLNEGFHRGGTFLRCKADSFEPETFNVFCPKALAGIGDLPPTVVDRSITVSMRRRLPSEKVEKAKFKRLEQACSPLREKLAMWAQEAIGHLMGAEPTSAPGLHDRADDVWEPLFAIADLAGGGWPERARAAATELCGAVEDESLGMRLLRDLLRVWPRSHAGDLVERVRSADLVCALLNTEDGPWSGFAPEWGRDFTAAALAKLLKPFGLGPKAMRISGFGSAQGYSVDAFRDPWHRYGIAKTPNGVNNPDKSSLDAHVGAVGAVGAPAPHSTPLVSTGRSNNSSSG
jgi:hypothetical protein